MNAENDPRHDELRDRLLDQALAEVLAGQGPPDLADRILAAAEKPEPVPVQRKERVMKKRWRLSISVGFAAACCAGVVIIVLVHSVQTARIAARRAQMQQLGKSLHPSHDAHKRYDAQAESGLRTKVYPVGDLVVPEQAPGTSSADARGVPLEHPPYLRDDIQHAPASPSKNKSDYEPLVDLITSPVEPEQYKDNETESWIPNQTIIIRQDEDRDIDEDIQGPLNPFGNSVKGRGPGLGGDKYNRIVENAFLAVKDHPLSTFSIDVDTASYANVRRFLLKENCLPPPDAVRIEEMINYFDYDYAGPTDGTPLAAHLAVAGCPWQSKHRLVRIALKGKTFPQKDRPASNLVFLLDVSGSMDEPDKLPLLVAGMKLLARQMRENDRVAIVVYAGAEGLVLPSTSGANRAEILEKLDSLQAGGSTNGGAGIELAYRIAQESFIKGGVNRVILCTDGDFNVGTTSSADLIRMVEDRAQKGVFLSVLGFGRGNLNDAMMESIADRGNGNYAYVDTLDEARKVLVRQMDATLVTIAKDVKIQIEFNPAQVAAYRLIGYENRMLAKEDFNDDKKDAGEIGAGHTVTALYEVVPAGVKVDTPPVDDLKYQPTAKPAKSGEDTASGAVLDGDEWIASGELLTVKLRYKDPDADESKKLEFPLTDRGQSFNEADRDFQFAASVAALGMILRDSKYKGTITYDAILEMATAAKGTDPHGYRAEFLKMVRSAKSLAESADRLDE